LSLPTITPANFTGWAKINANGFKEADLEAYIETFLTDYLRGIVGASAYSAIQAESRAKWTDLLNGVDFTDADGEVQHLEGLKKAIIFFIYFEFIRDNFVSAQTGQVNPLSENSDPFSGTNTLEVARSRFNRGVRGLESVPDFLEAYEDLSEIISASVDNADDTYLLSIPSTKYLEVGDPLAINFIEYTVLAVVADTSLTINAGEVGLAFQGESLSWDPFEKVNFCPVGLCGI
jgi:hypothetical protein